MQEERGEDSQRMVRHPDRPSTLRLHFDSTSTLLRLRSVHRAQGRQLRDRHSIFFCILPIYSVNCMKPIQMRKLFIPSLVFTFLFFPGRAQDADGYKHVLSVNPAALIIRTLSFSYTGIMNDKEEWTFNNSFRLHSMNDNVIVLGGDITGSVMTSYFKKEFL